MTMQGDRLLKIPEVEEMVALKKTAIYVRIADGSFPRALQIGPRVVRWRLSDIQNWINDPQQSWHMVEAAAAAD